MADSRKIILGNKSFFSDFLNKLKSGQDEEFDINFDVKIISVLSVNEDTHVVKGTGVASFDCESVYTYFPLFPTIIDFEIKEGDSLLVAENEQYLFGFYIAPINLSFDKKVDYTKRKLKIDLGKFILLSDEIKLLSGDESEKLKIYKNEDFETLLKDLGERYNAFEEEVVKSLFAPLKGANTVITGAGSLPSVGEVFKAVAAFNDELMKLLEKIIEEHKETIKNLEDFIKKITTDSKED